MKLKDIVMSKLYSRHKLRVYRSTRFVYLQLCNSKRRKSHAVKLLLVSLYGIIAISLDVIKHRLNHIIKLGRIYMWTYHNIAPLVDGWILVYLHI